MKTREQRPTNKQHVTCGILFFFVVALLCASSANAAQRVLILGDSLMKNVARETKKKTAKMPDLEAVSLVSIGAGLVRQDLFDWPAKITIAVDRIHPDVAVLLMGTNDNQPLKTAAGVVQPGSDAWNKAYQQRVEKVTTILLNGGTKKVYWIKLPIVRDAALQTEVDNINALVASVCDAHPNATVLDFNTLITTEPDIYSPYILKDDGMPLQIRSADGIHFNRNGSKLIADAIINQVQ